MKTKRGISLVVLVITIIVTVIVTTLTILQIDNVMGEINRDDFIVEVTTIEDKIKEYYLLTGSLPVIESNQYTADELKEKLAEGTKSLLYNEIVANEDVANTFYEIDISKLGIEITERGLKKDATDIYVVATNSLNVYYLKGCDIEGTMYFSTGLLVTENKIEDDEEITYDAVTLTDDLNLIKNTNVWTNEIVITINSNISYNQQLQYSIAGMASKEVVGKIITINENSMTADEKTAFSTNKVVTVNKLENDTVITSEQISISNLDIEAPTIGNIESIDTTETGYNVLNVVRADTGGSGIKAIYYDYNQILKDGTVSKYYTDRTTVTPKDLLEFGKIATTGSIKLTKNVKSIVALVIDNAANISDIVTYTIEDEYVESE